MAQRSRRRLSFPPAEERGEVCALCGIIRMRTSKYPCWKNVSSQQCAQSLGVDAESPICCPCRDDISQLVKDPSYVPRWGKKKTKKKGCKCKTGCRNKRCGCRGKEKTCSVGCECINCTNTPAMEKESSNLLDITMDDHLSDVEVDEIDDLTLDT